MRPGRLAAALALLASLATGNRVDAQAEPGQPRDPTQPASAQAAAAQAPEGQLAPGDPAPASGTAAREDEAEAESTASEVEEAAGEAEPAARRTCTSADVLRGLCTNADALRASAEKPWRLMARGELQVPVVFDETPETETRVGYYVGAELDLPWLLRGLYATAWLGLSQRLWRFEGQPAVDWEDPLFALGYRHTVPVSAEHNLVLLHRVGAYFPASRPSRANLVYGAADWLTAVRYPFQVEGLGGFTAGINVAAQYQFRQYDSATSDLVTLATIDRPGGANTRLQLEAGGVLQYAIFDNESAGNLQSQVSTGYRNRLRYDGSSQPDWYWALGAIYTPIPYLSVSLALEHGYSDLLRGGVGHVIAFNRDETAWRLGVFGRY